MGAPPTRTTSPLARSPLVRFQFPSPGALRCSAADWLASRATSGARSPGPKETSLALLLTNLLLFSRAPRSMRGALLFCVGVGSPRGRIQALFSCGTYGEGWVNPNSWGRFASRPSYNRWKLAIGRFTNRPNGEILRAPRIGCPPPHQANRRGVFFVGAGLAPALFVCGRQQGLPILMGYRGTQQGCRYPPASALRMSSAWAYLGSI